MELYNEKSYLRSNHPISREQEACKEIVEG